MTHVQSLPSAAVAEGEDDMVAIPVNVIASRPGWIAPDLICHGHEDVE
jgi:hypothetical protein